MEKEQKHNHSNKRPRTSSSKNKEMTEKGVVYIAHCNKPLTKEENVSQEGE
jgi:alkyl hydroperoxide reductase subunit AhpF